MGYYTQYTLQMEKFDSDDKMLNEDELLPIISELRSTYKSASYAIDEMGEFKEDCTWYEHEDEMKEFSKKHPTILFTLIGEGEESGDLWEKHFLNGKMQTCNATINFPPFDVNKLK